jgi:hypothetical protein
MSGLGGKAEVIRGDNDFRFDIGSLVMTELFVPPPANTRSFGWGWDGVVFL